MRFPAAATAAACALALATACVVRPLGKGPLQLELGGYEQAFIDGPWSAALRADLDPPAVRDGPISFYFRSLRSRSSLSLPVVLAGDATLTLRGRGSLRAVLAVYTPGTRVAEVLVDAGPWSRYAVPLPGVAVAGRPLELSFSLTPFSGVRMDVPRVDFMLDRLEIASPAGAALSPSACLVLAAVPLAVFAFALLLGHRPWSALRGAAGAAALTILAGWADPLRTVLAAPRLVPAALLAGLAAQRLLGRDRSLAARERAGLAWLVAAGIAIHGALVFFPDHQPPGIRPHINRALDLEQLPLDYHSLLRYGSHFPSASQGAGDASAALGRSVMIPYSPFPYVFYYLVHLAGLDLYWALTVVGSVLAMAVAPVLWLAARAIWNVEAAWLAALLYTLDLAVWHHVARAHAPAVFGGALATAALAAFASRAQALADPHSAARMGVVLGGAVLGYSSLPVLVGLFGLSLLALLAVDARGLPLPAKQGITAALLLGGALAGGLYYFHYLPGLLGDAAHLEGGPEVFEGRSFFIFHNEAKENMRIWLGGYWIGLLAGLLAAPFALLRAKAAARPVLGAWLAAWALLMLLKEPFLFPRLLRWAKEDQFVSPLMCLFVAAAVAGIAPARPRWALAALVLAGAAAIQVRDFLFHTNTLSF